MMTETWFQVLALIASNIVLFLWVRTESRADHRALESWTKTMLTSIQAEIKDFHGRLCAIEERKK
jgi:hypothetical protein